MCLTTLSIFLSVETVLQSTARPHQSIEKALERVASHIKASLFILVAAMGKCKQINNSNLRYVSDVISLFMRKITQFRQCHASYLNVTSINRHGGLSVA